MQDRSMPTGDRLTRPDWMGFPTRPRSDHFCVLGGPVGAMKGFGPLESGWRNAKWCCIDVSISGLQREFGTFCLSAVAFSVGGGWELQLIPWLGSPAARSDLEFDRKISEKENRPHERYSNSTQFFTPQRPLSGPHRQPRQRRNALRPHIGCGSSAVRPSRRYAGVVSHFPGFCTYRKPRPALQSDTMRPLAPSPRHLGGSIARPCLASIRNTLNCTRSARSATVASPFVRRARSEHRSASLQPRTHVMPAAAALSPRTPLSWPTNVQQLRLPSPFVRIDNRVPA
ncbi:uncharacterized protein PAN0_005c2575 [Moesziomyces antarcticus]|uniref:Uncharacterized protein n=1 Tax=Pseudozyma antarctica TaxID=84753 RepID=A0A081CCG6_PSEA2|nr:uncharacterized protein PAN0_005c2575 [Moesziomyces antarcticus]GAK64362.1 hypothetical protein PAN0_005c2575 [Moesziomyces antarcticus]